MAEAQQKVAVAQADLDKVRAGAQQGEIGAQDAEVSRLMVERQTQIVAQEAEIGLGQSVPGRNGDCEILARPGESVGGGSGESGIVRLGQTWEMVAIAEIIAGIAFADILIFMQLGFEGALYYSNTKLPRQLNADLVMFSAEVTNLQTPYTFSRRRLYQAQDVPGIKAVNTLYVGSLSWRKTDHYHKPISQRINE